MNGQSVSLDHSLPSGMNELHAEVNRLAAKHQPGLAVSERADTRNGSH